MLRTCVENEALGGLMPPRLNSDLDVLAAFGAAGSISHARRKKLNLHGFV